MVSCAILTPPARLIEAGECAESNGASEVCGEVEFARQTSEPRRFQQKEYEAARNRGESPRRLRTVGKFALPLLQTKKEVRSSVGLFSLMQYSTEDN